MEIGSEFWLENIKRKNEIEYEINENETLFISGRTAIDYALKLILEKGEVRNIYFPSYCCQSMLEPFLERKIKIDFYDVFFEENKFVYNIDKNKKCDIFFAMNYFGYFCNNMDYYIEEFKRKGAIVIEDSTHSWLSERKYNKHSNFVVASLRKWFPIISGGILIDLSNTFKSSKDIKLDYNKDYINIKRKAMETKRKYINGNENIKKSEFLDYFMEANSILNKNYKNYRIDNESKEILENLDMNDIIETRKNNVRAIYRYLKQQNEIKYIEDINLEVDCPIFVPIFLKDKEKRNLLKSKLIEHQVYCPNHWSIPGILNNDNQKQIYNKELSLVCDQRYSEEQINEYLNLLNEG